MTAACVFTISVVLAVLDTCEDGDYRNVSKVESVVCARPGQKVDEVRWHNKL